MKTRLLLLLPFFAHSQDTLPAIIKLQQGNIHKYVKGYVVLDKDCKALEFIRVNTWRKKEKLLKFKETVVDWRLINN